MTLIDTAEMYGNGGAERVVADAIAGRREEVFIVSKVLPQNASRDGTIAACERSLHRLGTDRLDLYLLHWRGRYPLKETLAGFEALMGTGQIRSWGVSNFDVADMEELVVLPGGNAVATNQVLYNLARRGIEADLLPWCATAQDPRNGLFADRAGTYPARPRPDGLGCPARRHARANRDCLAVLREVDIMVIPKARTLAHVRDNLVALDVELTRADLAELARAFPPPSGTQPLEML